jgi:type II secretory pathway pseudopilin PulG
MSGFETDCSVHSHDRRGEQGFLLVGVIVLVALLLLVLSIAAPIVAKDLRRERELEAVHRGQQYTRAIRLYYKKFNSYPATVKQLEKTNNERFLRQHYLDPMTGKDDWRLIAVGTNKTTVKGFFGQPLAGIAGTGLGSAAGLQSGGLGAGTTGGAAGAPGVGGVPGASGPGGSTDPGAIGTGIPGSTSGTPGQAGPTGQAGSGTSSFGSSSFGSSSSGSAFGEGGSTGPFMGVGVPKDANSIITLNEQTNYSTWEFLYDPRIEQLYSKASIFGGGIATSSGGLGSASGLSSTPGTGSGNAPATGPGSGPGTNGPSTDGTNSGGTGSGGAAPTTPAAPVTTPQ